MKTKIKELKKQKLKGVLVIFLGWVVFVVCLFMMAFVENDEFGMMLIIFGGVSMVLMLIKGCVAINSANSELNSIYYGGGRVAPEPPRPQILKEDGSGRCPNCNRAYYRQENYCKWCGVVFDQKGNVVPNVIYRAPDYFRHPWDINNVEPYDTLRDPLNHIFYSYLSQNLTDCKIEAKVQAHTLFPNAMAYAMPLNFLVTDGNKKIAVLLVGKQKTKRFSLLETKQLCKENGIDVLCFYFECENAEDYVVARVRKALNK